MIRGANVMQEYLDRSITAVIEMETGCHDVVLQRI